MKDKQDKSPSRGLKKLRAELDSLEQDSLEQDSLEQDIHTKHIICADGIRREFISKDKVRQAIGEDEPRVEGEKPSNYRDNKRRGRNQLRAEIRKGLGIDE